jgi:hypothetical protein
MYGVPTPLTRRASYTTCALVCAPVRSHAVPALRGAETGERGGHGASVEGTARGDPLLCLRHDKAQGGVRCRRGSARSREHVHKARGPSSGWLSGPQRDIFGEQREPSASGSPRRLVRLRRQRRPPTVRVVGVGITGSRSQTVNPRIAAPSIGAADRRPRPPARSQGPGAPRTAAHRVSAWRAARGCVCRRATRERRRVR